MKGIRLVIRLLTMVPVILSLCWDMFSATGLWIAVLSSWMAIVVAELPVLNRLRQRVVIVVTMVGLIATQIVGWWMLNGWFWTSFFGPKMVLTLHLWFTAGFGFATLVLGFRLLAKKSRTWFFFEMALIALSTAVIFFPHQYKIVIRPLWLSDLAWSMGLEPSVALGFVGVALASLLSILTVLDRSRRVHVSIVLLPLLSLLALIFVDPMEMETPPPPERLEDILNGGQSNEQTSRGGSGGQSDEDDQNVNSGQQEKQEGSAGTPPPVAVVLLGDDYEPPNETFYLRQEIQSQFNGLRLVAPTDQTIPYDAPRGFPNQEVQFQEPPDDGYRKSVMADVALLTQHTAPILIESPIQYTPTVNPRPGRFVRTYRSVSMPLNVGYERFLDLSIGSPHWSTDYWEHLTQTPPDPRYAELAQSIVAQLPLEYRDNLVAQAFAIKLFLDEQTQYTMKERHENAADPTAEFLFGPHKQFIGYCVHTSHAAAYLWRSIGIPARIGVGYATPAEQQKGSAILVLANDAHSWPELYFEELGWVILDVAPQTTLDEMGDPPDLAMLDALEELARAEPDSQFRQTIDWRALWQEYKVYLYAVGMSLLIILAVSLIAWKGLRRWQYRYSKETYWVYISAMDALSEQGCIRLHGESPEYFARRVQSIYPSLSPIVWAHIQSSFGEPMSDVSTLRVHRHQLSTEIHSQFSHWRLWMGWLNPFSPWRTR